MGRVFRDKTATRRFATRAQRDVMRDNYVRFRTDPESRKPRKISGTLAALIGESWVTFTRVTFPMSDDELAVHILTATRLRSVSQ